MESIPISKFKATCMAVLQRVRRTGRPILITRFGRPVAEIAPPSPARAPGDWLGSMEGRATIEGEVVAPALESRAWKALRK